MLVSAPMALPPVDETRIVLSRTLKLFALVLSNIPRVAPEPADVTTMVDNSTFGVFSFGVPVPFECMP